MSENLRIGVLWSAFDPLLYCNMKTGAIVDRLGPDTGRLLQLAAVQKLFQGSVRFIDPAIGANAICAVSDIVVVIGVSAALSIRLGIDKTLLENLTVPILVLDLQVGQLEPPELEWLGALGPKSAIWVNSAVEQAKLQRADVPRIACGASIAQFLNTAPDLGARIAANWARRGAPEAICVVAGSEKRTRPVERQLVSLAFGGPIKGTYLVQQGLQGLQIARGEFANAGPADIETLRKRSNPDMKVGEFRRFCRNHVKAYFNAGAWMESLRRYDLVAGSHFQAVALALQAQRMGLMIAENDTVEGLCSEAGLPYIRTRDFETGADRAYLKSVIRFTPERYRAVRARSALALNGFLQEFGISLRPPFRRLLKT